MCKPGTGPHTWPYTNTEHTHPLLQTLCMHIYARTHTQAHTRTHRVQKRHLVSISPGGQFASGKRADISRGGQRSGQWGVVVWCAIRKDEDIKIILELVGQKSSV